MLSLSVFFNTVIVYPGERANSGQQMDKDDINICSVTLFSSSLPESQLLLTLIRMTKDEKVLAFFKGLLL